jgi:hypothetical protein
MISIIGPSYPKNLSKGDITHRTCVNDPDGLNFSIFQRVFGTSQLPLLCHILSFGIDSLHYFAIYHREGEQIPPGRKHGVFRRNGSSR